LQRARRSAAAALSLAFQQRARPGTEKRAARPAKCERWNLDNRASGAPQVIDLAAYLLDQNLSQWSVKSRNMC